MPLVLVLIGQPILVGFAAQKWRGRTGVLWALIALAVDLGVAFAFDAAIRDYPGTSQYGRAAGDIAFALGVFILGTAIMAAAVASLRSRQS